MRRCHWPSRQTLGAALVLIGMLMIFLCLSLETFALMLGVVLAALGLALLTR